MSYLWNPTSWNNFIANISTNRCIAMFVHQSRASSRFRYYLYFFFHLPDSATRNNATLSFFDKNNIIRATRLKFYGYFSLLKNLAWSIVEVFVASLGVLGLMLRSKLYQGCEIRIEKYLLVSRSLHT